METSILTESAFDSDEPPPARLREKPLRRITFNGKPLTAQQQRCLESLELSLGLTLPDRCQIGIIGATGWSCGRILAVEERS